MRLEIREGERGERWHVLRVLLRLAVRHDHLAVHDHPRRLDVERSDVEVDYLPACAVSSQCRIPDVASSARSAKNRSCRERCKKSAQTSRPTPYLHYELGTGRLGAWME